MSLMIKKILPTFIARQVRKERNKIIWSKLKINFKIYKKSLNLNNPELPINIFFL